MHYKNGRPAKNGDPVVLIAPFGGIAVAGILYDATPGNDACNGRLARPSPNDPYPDLRNCLHADDVRLAHIPDSTAPAPVDRVAGGDCCGSVAEVPEPAQQEAPAPVVANPVPVKDPPMPTTP